MRSQSNLPSQNMMITKRPLKVPSPQKRWIQRAHPLRNISKLRSLNRHIRHHLHFLNLHAQLWMKDEGKKTRQWIRKLRVLKNGIQAGFSVLGKGMSTLYQQKTTSQRIRTVRPRTQYFLDHNEETRKFWKAENRILHDDHKLAGAWSIPLD